MPPGGGYDPPRAGYGPPGQDFRGSKLGSLGVFKAKNLKKEIPMKNEVEWYPQKLNWKHFLSLFYKKSACLFKG